MKSVCVCVCILSPTCNSYSGGGGAAMEHPTLSYTQNQQSSFGVTPGTGPLNSSAVSFSRARAHGWTY